MGAAAVDAFWRGLAIGTIVALTTTTVTTGLALTLVFSMSVTLAVETTEWVWHIGFNLHPIKSSINPGWGLWDGKGKYHCGQAKRNIPTVASEMLDPDDTLGFQFSNQLFVSKFSKGLIPNHSFAIVQTGMGDDLHRLVTNVFQLFQAV